MRDHYDFSESVPNPYAKKLKKQITVSYTHLTLPTNREV